MNHRRDRFDIGKVLERLVEKGKIVAKKAYADWSRFAQYTAPLHEAAIELIEIPRRGQTGKNSADIRLCVDAMDLAYSKDHIDTFVIVSGDSDFSPLVSKLKELGKHVIGLGLAEATSDLLRDNCDEFIYYEDLGPGAVDRPRGLTVAAARRPSGRRSRLLLESLLALRRENKEVLWSSMVKDTMKRKKPSFNEEYHGYRTFSELLEDAAKDGLIEIERHKGERDVRGDAVRVGAEGGGPGAGARSAAAAAGRDRRARTAAPPSGGRAAEPAPPAGESPGLAAAAGDAPPPAGRARPPPRPAPPPARPSAARGGRRPPRPESKSRYAEE